MRFHQALLPLLLGCVLGCGGSSRPVPPSGALSVRLGSDSINGYGQVVVSVDKVEGSLDGVGWVGLGDVKATYDLQALQNGNSVTLVTGARTGAGNYSQFRVTWAAVNYLSNINLPAYVVPQSGPGMALQMPATTILPGNVQLAANGSATVQLMLSGQQAVQVHAGAALFQATGAAMDAAGTARVTGHLGDGGSPLAGAEVYAETVDGNLLASIQRRALTDASGNYVLEALATGGVYYVAAQPSSAAGAYGALTAAPVNALTASSYGANLAFGAPAAAGALSVTVTPGSGATDATWVELRQTLLTGPGVGQNLVVRSVVAGTAGGQDTALFQGLAPGVYGIKVLRSSNGGTPLAKVGGSQMVTSGSTAAVTISIP